MFVSLRLPLRGTDTFKAQVVFFGVFGKSKPLATTASSSSLSGDLSLYTLL